MSLGRQIQIARVTKGWKQQDLRKATGLSQKHLSLIENDKAKPGAHVQPVAAALIHFPCRSRRM